MEGGKVVDMAKRNHAQRATLTLVACSALVVAGCGTAKPQPEGSDTPGEAAGAPGTWELLNAGDMTAESTTLQLGVTRASCAGGRIPRRFVWRRHRLHGDRAFGATRRLHLPKQQHRAGHGPAAGTRWQPGTV